VRRAVPGFRADLAIVSDHAASRRIAAEIEAREREQARQAARPAIGRLLDRLRGRA
jgi:hypothetical protein